MTADPAAVPVRAELREMDRETLGRLVREAWIKWARTQRGPKPHWLLPYEQLEEADKEADRQIGEAIFYLAEDRRKAAVVQQWADAQDKALFDAAKRDSEATRALASYAAQIAALERERDEARGNLSPMVREAVEAVHAAAGKLREADFHQVSVETLVGALKMFVTAASMVETAAKVETALAAVKAERDAMSEKIELQEIALDDLCVSLNKERATSALLREALTEYDRLSLIIESSVRFAGKGVHEPVLAAIKAGRAALKGESHGD